MDIKADIKNQITKIISPQIKTQIANIEKWSLAEATSNSDGKSSGSGTAGILIVFVSCLGFLLGVYDHIWGTKTSDVMIESLAFCGVGAGLLGYRKGKDHILAGKVLDANVANNQLQTTTDTSQVLNS